MVRWRCVEGVYYDAQLTAEQEAEVVEHDDGIDRTPWGVVGTLKNLPKLLPEMKALPLNPCEPLALQPVPLPVCERLQLLNEDTTTRGEWDEVDALMPTRKVEPAALTLKDNYGDD